MFGMVDDNVEIVKLFGRRDINMDANMKALFYEDDRYSYGSEIHYPYFNDAKELFLLRF